LALNQRGGLCLGRDLKIPFWSAPVLGRSNIQTIKPLEIERTAGRKAVLLRPRTAALRMQFETRRDFIAFRL